MRILLFALRGDYVADEIKVEEISADIPKQGSAPTPSASAQEPEKPGPTHSEAIVEKIAEQVAPPAQTDDEALLAFVEQTKPRVFVIGTGGSGTNTLDRLFELNVKEVTLLAMNTDARHLLKVRAHRKLLLGKTTTKGHGAGSNPQMGEAAAKESTEEIKSTLAGASMVFVTCGLGGGTGTGSAAIIAEQAKAAGALVISIVTLPFSSEGRVRLENALSGLDRLRRHSDTVIVIKNDKLLTLAPNLPLNTAFKVCDEVLAGSVKGIAELVTKAGLVNVDFADLKTILTQGGFAVIGLGEANVDAKVEDRATIAVETALNSPLLDADLTTANRALINVVGGEDMTLKEAELIVAETAKRIHPNAHIIWGARVEPTSQKTSLRTMIVLTGVKFEKQEMEAGLETLDLDLIG
ncbi:Cell division protein FtsZ 1 [uncultured archaeon]|nr:Cell division protein FtsZ 1 [uncultured archaeon]